MLKRAIVPVIGFFWLMVFGACAQEQVGQAPAQKLLPEGISQSELDQAVAQVEDYSRLGGYVAVARENLSLCSDEECKNYMSSLLDYRYIGEGRCDKCTKGFCQEVCPLVKNNNCSSAKEDRGRETCEAILSGNTGRVQMDNDLAESLGIIAGYRKGQPACEAFVKEFVPAGEHGFFSCRILFSGDSQKVFKKIAVDLALRKLAIQKKNPRICDAIIDIQILKNCYESRSEAGID